jgi:hypothetical protein
MLLLMVPEQVWDWHCCSYCFHVQFFFWFLGPLLSVLSFLLWNSLWLVEEVLTLLCLFLVARMWISWFLWEIQFDHTYMYQLYYCQLWEHFWAVLLVSFLSLWQRQTWCSVDTHLFRIANESHRTLTGFCDISWSAFLEGIFRVLLQGFYWIWLS